MANINDILTTLEGRVGDTKHLKSDRSQRSKFVKELKEIENAVLVTSITVDKGHWNGEEIHEIWSNGVIEIFNKRTHLHITDLIARPAQIERYFTRPEEYGNNPFPKGYQTILAFARKHTELGYNNL